MIAAAGAALLIVVLALVFWPQDVQFDGDRVRNRNPERFWLRFDAMNTEDAETLPLAAGDTLRVSWQIDGGSVELVIARAGEKPIYQANGRGKGDAASFDLTIPVSGDYTISIAARNARGWMEFVQAAGE